MSKFGCTKLRDPVGRLHALKFAEKAGSDNVRP